MNAGYLIFNSEGAAWDQAVPEPYSWSPRMLVLYSGFVAKHLRLLGSSGNFLPTFGTFWLYEIDLSPENMARTPGFLPGADRALSDWRLDFEKGNLEQAAARLAVLRRLGNGAVIYDSLLGWTYHEMGRKEDCYRLFKRAVDAGVIHDKTLLICYSLAAQLEKRGAYDDLHRQALRWYPLPEYQSYIGKVNGKYRLLNPGRK